MPRSAAIHPIPLDAPEALADPTPSPRTGAEAIIAVPIIAVHILGPALAPFTYTRAGLIALAIMYVFTGLGVTAGAHRLFTHGSYRPAPIVRDLLAFAFLLTGQGTLRRWVRDHHIHHRYSDRDGDPHSPRLLGLFGAHFGWLWKKPPGDEGPALFARFTGDFDPGPVARLFRTPGRLVALHLAVVAVAYVTGAFIEAGLSLRALVDGARTGASLVVWGVLLRIVVVMQMTFLANSAGHRFGVRRHDTGDDSRNLPGLALLTLGDGFHNNHHARAGAANHGFHAPWEIDLTFLLLAALAVLGLVSDVRVYRPSTGRVERWWRRGPPAP